MLLNLIRRAEFVPLSKVFYFRFNEGEVDFVLKEGVKVRQLIQVTYASGEDEIERRETKALVKASELLKYRELLIITWDYEDELKVNRKIVRCLPLWKWLLTNDSLCLKVRESVPFFPKNMVKI